MNGDALFWATMIAIVITILLIPISLLYREASPAGYEEFNSIISEYGDELPAEIIEEIKADGKLTWAELYELADLTKEIDRERLRKDFVR